MNKHYCKSCNKELLGRLVDHFGSIWIMDEDRITGICTDEDWVMHFNCYNCFKENKNEKL